MGSLKVYKFGLCFFYPAEELSVVCGYYLIEWLKSRRGCTLTRPTVHLNKVYGAEKTGGLIISSVNPLIFITPSKTLRVYHQGLM